MTDAPGDPLAEKEAELKKLKAQAREDRKLFEKAADTLAEIDRGPGLTDEQADVLAALRIRVEGKPRKSLEDLLSAAGDIKGKRDLGDVLPEVDEGGSSGWPEIKEKKRDWPTL
jgi:hypothetical protein